MAETISTKERMCGPYRRKAMTQNTANHLKALVIVLAAFAAFVAGWVFGIITTWLY
jgi:hypothetical protein